MIKKYNNTLMPLGLMAISIVLFISSFSMKSLSHSAVGPEFVPRILSVALFVLSFVDFFIELKKCRKQNQINGILKADGKEEKNNEEDKKVKEKLPFEKKYSFPLTIALIFVYIASMELIGFILTTIAYLFLQIYIYSHKRDKKSLILYAIISVVTSLAIYFLFVKVFMLFLPSGILG